MTAKWADPVAKWADPLYAWDGNDPLAAAVPNVHATSTPTVTNPRTSTPSVGRVTSSPEVN